MRSMRQRVVAGLMAGMLGSAVLTGCSSNSDSGTTVSSSEVTSGSSLSVDQFASLIEDDGVVLIDVRTPEEYAAGHLAGAQNIDVESADFSTKIAELDPSVTYALYCRTGHRSGAAMTAMQAAGFTSVTDLAGGITDWASAGQTVVTN